MLADVVPADGDVGILHARGHKGAQRFGWVLFRLDQAVALIGGA